MCKIEEKASLAHHMQINHLRWDSIHQPGLGECHWFHKHIVGVSGLTVEGNKGFDGATAGLCTMLKNYMMVCPVFQMFVGTVHFPCLSTFSLVLSHASIPRACRASTSLGDRLHIADFPTLWNPSVRGTVFLLKKITNILFEYF